MLSNSLFFYVIWLRHLFYFAFLNILIIIIIGTHSFRVHLLIHTHTRRHDIHSLFFFLFISKFFSNKWMSKLVHFIWTLMRIWAQFRSLSLSFIHIIIIIGWLLFHQENKKIKTFKVLNNFSFIYFRWKKSRNSWSFSGWLLHPSIHSFITGFFSSRFNQYFKKGLIMRKRTNNLN